MGLSKREVAYCFGESGSGAVEVGVGVSSVEERWMPSSSSSGSIVGRAGGFVEGSDILNEKERENDGNRYGKQKVVTEGVSSDLVSNEIGFVQERSIAKEALWVVTC